MNKQQNEKARSSPDESKFQILFTLSAPLTSFSLAANSGAAAKFNRPTNPAPV